MNPKFWADLFSFIFHQHSLLLYFVIKKINFYKHFYAFLGQCWALHCEKSWWKTPPAWPDVTDSLVRGTENFFDMKIELIRRVPTTKTEYFEIIGISCRFFVLQRRSFPTIFRQLSDEWIIKSSTSETRSHVLQGYNPLLYHCATLPLCENVWQN